MEVGQIWKVSSSSKKSYYTVKVIEISDSNPPEWKGFILENTFNIISFEPGQIYSFFYSFSGPFPDQSTQNFFELLSDIGVTCYKCNKVYPYLHSIGNVKHSMV